jgi:catechol 2,3-dioxygenase-like lactoylglutathione lyase family enzyme
VTWSPTHGRILSGVVTTPDLTGSVADYRDRLGLTLVEQGPLAPDLAASWDAPAVAGAPSAVLRPRSGAGCYLRLVEQPLPADFQPTRTFGWNAFELTVQDVFGWPDRLAGTGFEIVGPPKEIPGLPYFVAMQMLGRGREMIYLNEVRIDTPSSDLPRAASAVDHMFIAIVATPDIESTLEWYKTALGLDEGGRYTIPYTMISKAFGQLPETLHSLAMVQKGRMPIIEIDAYPAEATPRAVPDGGLPPGNALVTLAVDRFDGRAIEWLSPPVARHGPLYEGGRAGVVRGPAGELLELVEIG